MGTLAVGDQVERPQVGGQGPADAAFRLVERGGRCRRRKLVGLPQDLSAPRQVLAEPCHSQFRVAPRGSCALLLAETGLGRPVARIQHSLETDAEPAQPGNRACGRDQAVLSGRQTSHFQAVLRAANIPDQLHEAQADLPEGAVEH